MGLLDQIGQAMNAGAPAATGNPDVLGALMGLVGGQGGLGGLLQQFTQGGLGSVVQSWVGTGANLPISADQIKSVLGGGQLEQLASQLGLPHDQVAGVVAQHLPSLVDKLTPTGQVPAQLPSAGDLGSLLGGLFGGK